MILLRGLDGQDYRTLGELARGGEGIIYTLQGRADLLVKLYLPAERTAEREAKLRAMIADPPRDEMRENFRHVSITWPLTLLHEKGLFVGYVMPRIHGGYSLVNAYNPRAKDSIGFDWNAQHQVATNLCTALYALHVKGYLMGDLNPRNILVTDQGLVTLVDTDSFQVRVGSTVHRCIVGTPEYTPRELQGQRFDQVDRAPEHDRFGLAVLVFQLLMDGFHPFAGALKDPSDSVEGKADEWCIQNGVFPWCDNRRFRKPPAARPLETLDARLQELFLRCFVSGHTQPFLRPSPKEWLDALNLAQQRLVRCSAGTHWRYPEAGPCHACDVQQRLASRKRPRIPPQAPVQSPPAVLQTKQPIQSPQTPTAAVVRLRWTLARLASVVGVLAVLVLAFFGYFGGSEKPSSQPGALFKHASGVPSGFINYFSEYAGKPGTKAIALALGSNNKWAAGYRFNAPSQQRANELALQECSKQLPRNHIDTSCKMYAEGMRLVWISEFPCEGCLIAHVCWMGNECVKEYLISSDRHGDQMKVRVRDDSITNGQITSRGGIENLTVSCKNEPPEDHAHAIEWTRWMAVCKGAKTQWSPTRDLVSISVSIPRGGSCFCGSHGGSIDGLHENKEVSISFWFNPTPANPVEHPIQIIRNGKEITSGWDSWVCGMPGKCRLAGTHIKVYGWWPGEPGLFEAYKIEL